MTTSSPEHIVDQMKTFFESFNENGKYKFVDKINSMLSSGDYSIEFDYADITSISSGIDQEIYEVLIHALKSNPASFINSMTLAVRSLAKDLHQDWPMVNKIQFRMINSPTVKEITDIHPEDTGSFIEIRGIVSDMISDLPQYFSTKVYKCGECGRLDERENKNIFNQKPAPLKCPQCGERQMEFDERESIKYARQYNIIEIQQLPEKASIKRVGLKIQCVVIGDDLVEKIIPADRVKITGIVSLKPTGDNNKRDVSTYDPFIEVNYISSITNSEEVDLKQYYPDIEEKLAKMDRNELFDQIINSIAPSITGDIYKPIKSSLWLQAVGAPPRKKSDGMRIRGDVNIGIFGAAGTAKTDMADWIAQISPRYIDAGQLSTKVGLTGKIEFGDKGKSATVRPGLYMMGNGGTVVVDEIDKLPKEELAALPSLMDNRQVLVLAKGGIVKKYPVRTASLHMGNPDGGRFDNTKTIVENFPNIEPWLWQRYDLVWILKQVTDREQNEQIADSVINSLLNSVSEKNYEEHGMRAKPKANTLDPELLKAMVQYAKDKFHPDINIEQMPKEHLQKIINSMKQFYMNLKLSKDTEDISPRVLETYVRLVLASARGHFRNNVEPIDYSIAEGLMISYIIMCGMNPDTGMFEKANLMFERSPTAVGDKKQSNVEKKRMIRSIILELSHDGEGWFERKILEDLVVERLKISRMEALPLIEEFIQRDYLSVPAFVTNSLQVNESLKKLNL